MCRRRLHEMWYWVPQGVRCFRFPPPPPAPAEVGWLRRSRCLVGAFASVLDGGCQNRAKTFQDASSELETPGHGDSLGISSGGGGSGGGRTFGAVGPTADTDVLIMPAAVDGVPVLHSGPRRSMSRRLAEMAPGVWCVM